MGILIMILMGLFLMLFGFIYFLAGGGITFLVKAFSGTLKSLPTPGPIIFGGMGLLFMAVGLVMLVIGLTKSKRKKALAEKISTMGVPAEAVVTFVDRNYSVQVNKTPIYSIVEFKFRDNAGREHAGRKTNVNSDLVNRLKLEVGSKIQIKYLNEDPNQNILLLPNANVTA